MGVGVIFVSHALAYYNFPREDKSGSLFEIYPENSKTISEIEFVDWKYQIHHTANPIRSTPTKAGAALVHITGKFGVFTL